MSAKAAQIFIIMLFNISVTLYNKISFVNINALPNLNNEQYTFTGFINLC